MMSQSRSIDCPNSTRARAGTKADGPKKSKIEVDTWVVDAPGAPSPTSIDRSIEREQEQEQERALGPMLELECETAGQRVLPLLVGSRIIRTKRRYHRPAQATRPVSVNERDDLQCSAWHGRELSQSFCCFSARSEYVLVVNRGSERAIRVRLDSKVPPTQQS